ncbi:metallopeptidase family protein [Paeniglutamicibacter cryotolerans]|uniref:Metallopeptidase family protein n=1 Tax=Paeniglutamicibacter cryotolerans TaxID=670079 RepID=A0A839QVC3_9MICC|nr:metallopeptidase family protein [Paeniglutamicibacter cryotolerans]MBB2995951.1 hypothetical protein [Paeniglutamicibacter cryotolerans]
MEPHLSIDLSQADAPGSTRPFIRRRRNRHGRGLRGSLMHQDLPGARTRLERFEDLVAESIERLGELWGETVIGIDFRIEQTPGRKVLDKAAATGTRVPLGKALAATPRRGARATIFRRPVEELSPSAMELPDVVHDAVVELVAELMAKDPEEVDPGYGRWNRPGR